MPIFEYVCDACQHQFEEIVMDPSETVSCPACHKAEVTKNAVSRFAFKSDGVFRSSSSSSGCGSCSSKGGGCGGCHC